MSIMSACVCIFRDAEACSGFTECELLKNDGIHQVTCMQNLAVAADKRCIHSISNRFRDSVMNHGFSKTLQV